MDPDPATTPSAPEPGLPGHSPQADPAAPGQDAPGTPAAGAAAQAIESPAGAPAGAVAPAPLEDPGFKGRGSMRRRARFLRKARELAYRDLGGLVFNLHRFGQRNDVLVIAKLTTLSHIDTELRALEAALEERHPVTILREAGISACPRCAAIHSGDDRFCPNCGLSMSRRVDLPVAGAPAPVAPAPGTAPQAAPQAAPPASGTAAGRLQTRPPSSMPPSSATGAPGAGADAAGQRRRATRRRTGDEPTGRSSPCGDDGSWSRRAAGRRGCATRGRRTRR